MIHAYKDVNGNLTGGFSRYPVEGANTVEMEETDPAFVAAKVQSEIATLRAEAATKRERIFAMLAGMQSEAVVNGDTATAQAIATAQATLRNITTQPAATSAQQYKALVLQAYKTLADSMPMSVKVAFAAALA